MLMQASQKVVNKAMLLACKCNCINEKQTNKIRQTIFSKYTINSTQFIIVYFN